jgi:hypothetical protein
MQGSYTGTELEVVIVQDNQDLVEIAGVDYSVDLAGRPGGAGMGKPANWYHKFGSPVGTFSISRRMLAKADQGGVFTSLVAGAAFIQQETIPTASATYTPTFAMQSLLVLRYVATGVRLIEGSDYTINWATGVITFTPTLVAAVNIAYMSDAVGMRGANLLTNSNFEDVLEGSWGPNAVVGCTVVQEAGAANVYRGLYSACCTPTLQNGGIWHVSDFAVRPGRPHVFKARIKGTSADTIEARFEDAAGFTAMTPAAAAIGSVDFVIKEWEFTPDEAMVKTVEIRNTDATPSLFYVDDAYLAEKNPALDPVGGDMFPFTFDVIWRRRSDRVTVRKLKGCAVYSMSASASEGSDAATEDISGNFLAFEGEP